MLQTADKGRQERHKVLTRAQAQIMTNIVLQNKRASLKKTRNPKDDDNLEKMRSKKPLLEQEKKKKQKEKDPSETPATMDFVEVSTSKKKKMKKEKKTGTHKSPSFLYRKNRPAANSVVITPEAGIYTESKSRE